MAALKERIEALQEKLKKLKAKEQRIEARKRATESKRKRAEETRRKILAGAVILGKVAGGEIPEAQWREWMDQALTRADDRTLFGLPPTEETDRKP